MRTRISRILLLVLRVAILIVALFMFVMPALAQSGGTDPVPPVDPASVAETVQALIAVVVSAVLTAAATIFGKYISSPAGAMLTSVITKFLKVTPDRVPVVGVIVGVLLWVIMALAVKFNVQAQVSAVLNTLYIVIPALAALISGILNQPAAYVALGEGLDRVRATALSAESAKPKAFSREYKR